MSGLIIQILMVSKLGEGVYGGLGGMMDKLREEIEQVLFYNHESDFQDKVDMILNLIQQAGYVHLETWLKTKPLEQDVGNLLAVIHGDGGQYISMHGWQKALMDAENIVLPDRGEFQERLETWLNEEAEGWKIRDLLAVPCDSHDCTTEVMGEPCWVDGGACKEALPRTATRAEALAGKATWGGG